MPGTHRPTAASRPPAAPAAAASASTRPATWTAAASPPARSMGVLSRAEMSPSAVNSAEAILVPPTSTAPQKMGPFLFIFFMFGAS